MVIGTRRGPSSNIGNKRRGSTSLVIQVAVTKIVEYANSFTSKKLGEVSVTQVMQAVLECGARHDTNEHYIATSLFVKKEEREMFMAFPTNEIRFNWLSRKYNDKYGNYTFFMISFPIYVI
jgi:hypothetical protein